MVTLEEAREIASKYMRDICGCTEYSTAYVFFNPAETDGGPDSPIVVMKDSGESCSIIEFITSRGGGKKLRGITF